MQSRFNSQNLNNTATYMYICIYGRTQFQAQKMTIQYSIQGSVGPEFGQEGQMVSFAL